MTEKEFEVMLTEFRQLRKGVAEAVRQIVQHEGEINALQSVMTYKGLATGQELDAAAVESARRLKQFLEQPEDGASGETAPRPAPEQSKPANRGCRERHHRART